MLAVSIIIPTLNEALYIGACLDSILTSDIDKSALEILVVDGESEDDTAKIVQAYMVHHPFIRLLKNPKKTIPHAMNIGIAASGGQYVIRVDAHALYPKSYFSHLLYWSKKLNADNVGGVCMTDVKNKTPKTESIKAVFSHKLGVGGGEYRSAVLEPKISNTIPFGCFKKESLEKYGVFDERLERGEDLEINKRIQDLGGKSYLAPDISFVYFAKETYAALAKKSFQTGKWTVLSAYLTKNLKALHMRHFIPCLFLLSLIIPLILCLIELRFCIFSLLSFLIYLGAIFTVSLQLKKPENRFIHLVATFFVLHFSYGLGSVAGIVKSVLLFLKG